MLSTIQKNIIRRALEIRQERGEKPEEAILSYTRLSEDERKEILERVSEKNAE